MRCRSRTTKSRAWRPRTTKSWPRRRRSMRRPSAKADAEEFLELLIPMCEEKAKEYEERNMFRANEDAAISKAIAILNADAAFDTFGKVDATSTGATSFLQFAS